MLLRQFSYLVLGITMFCCFNSSAAFGRTGGNLGLGIILFEPTGITFKNYVSPLNAWDGALGWDIDDYLYVHADYLLHKKDVFREKAAAMSLHYGVGGRFIHRDDDRKNGKGAKANDDDDDNIVGARVPFGLDFTFDDMPLEIFAELALTLDILPETDFDLGIALGGRYFFK